MQQVIQPLSTGICNLLLFLNNTRKEFEIAMEKMICAPVIDLSGTTPAGTTQQKMLAAASLEKLQVPEELRTTKSFNCNELLSNIRSVFSADSMKEIADICAKSERFFEYAHRSIVQEYFSYPSLNAMVQYQLHGIRQMFNKIQVEGLYA